MTYLKDISILLGISVSTVSRALNGYSDISEETRQKVIRAAEELDYRRESIGQARRNHRSKGAIGIIAPGIGRLLESAYYREMLCAMTAEAAIHNCDVVIIGAERPEKGTSWTGKAVLRRVGGICLLTEKERLYSGEFADLYASGIPLIDIEREGKSGPDETGRAAVRKLIDLIASPVQEASSGQEASLGQEASSGQVASPVQEASSGQERGPGR